MAEEKTNADALRMHLTGADSDGGAQTDPDASLGKYRSSTEVEQLAATVTNPIANITIDHIAGANGTGAGTMTGGVDILYWAAPGESNGAGVAIANGETKVIESDTPGKYIRVTRTSAESTLGTATVTIANVMNNVIGSGDISSAEAVAGVTKYRCIAFKNDHAADSVTVLKVWLNTLGTQRISATTQLGASGAGTIAIAAGTFDDWPDTGYCRIQLAAGTEREIVYYSSRTSTVLTVPAAGRELLGTTAAAGAADDTVDAVPGIRIAKDAPDAQPAGVFEDETASDEVDPFGGGGTWFSGIVAAAGESIGTLTAGQIYGLWIQRQTPAGYVASASIENAINFSFDV